MVLRKRYRPRLKLKHRGPVSPKHLFLATCVIFLIINLCSLWLVSAIIEPIIMSVAKHEVKDTATEAVNEAIHHHAKDIDINKLIIIHESGDKNKPTYSFNPSIYNKLLTELTTGIQNNLGVKTNQMKGSKNALTKNNKSVIYYIPLGAATQNALFANLGPKMPINMTLLGSVEPELKTKLTSTGINNTYLEIFVRINVEIQVAIPSLTEDTSIVSNIKVGDLFIPGEVPDYNGNGSPAITLPPKGK
ncbi:sporulation protein YunB [Bacillus sp. WMMC1349]|uniref:sporulation protein YunB n=1 Tax=Bacillus sp. WMMC1349 TaxID=2736254 RepID=UPI0015558C44|nr:sporulation protein YunB [Bacillus sp. WMMC1349]NPC93617.1 sporulation protein YunB [Bacillus sp. WMMC1349]